jgi:hypothetical protein
MRHHLSLFAACSVVLAWSGPAGAEDRTFGGYECTDECSGHAAGYRWAEKKEITEGSECPLGASYSFLAGCLAYTEDPNRGADQDDDGNPIEEWI